LPAAISSWLVSSQGSVRQRLNFFYDSVIFSGNKKFFSRPAGDVACSGNKKYRLPLFHIFGENLQINTKEKLISSAFQLPAMRGRMGGIFCYQ
jgi:hypothetical protein